ncbi:UVDDB domain that is present in CPSF-A and damage specific DNA binding [Cryptosporidium sp. chipmunk genotype I]|uniref:UVDDB domain that is present in CPSF-A and damage specific DNA binding n=1 Tax=Cryptosporidium sp. chipmunk genotype I TaxID=1280935 RepID=UPI00351A0D32|nr:UVDDB domain that is present in CPSF-A and damage specific DNA binding [Cryptosporidium sp. chipmunk genotype I]
MSQYNYVVTAYESGSFKGILKVDLFGDGISRLLAIRTRSMEIYEVNKNAIVFDEKILDDEIIDIPALNKVGTVEIYKDIIEIDKWHPKSQDFDDVLIFTREYELILLRAYLLDSGSEKILYMSILDEVSLYKENLRKSQLFKMMVHSEKNRIVILAYEGCLQVVGCELLSKDEENKTVFTSPLILRLSELSITDICLVNTTNERSLLGILYDSGYSSDPRLMKIIELPIDLRKWSYNTNMGHVMQQNVFKIAPLFYRSKRQKMVKGFFLFGDGIVQYRSIEEVMPNKTKSSEVTSSTQKIIISRFNSAAFSGMDVGLSPLSITDILNLDDGSRWLILDNLGRLFIMLVDYDQDDIDKVVDIRLNMLNRYSPFSRIVDLGGDLFFLASKLSDSLLLYSKNNNFYIISSLPNIGPIRDLLFTNLNKKEKTKYEAVPGQISKRDFSPLIAACGFGSGGALKSICNGIGLQNLYIGNDSFVGQITKIFSLAGSIEKVIVTGIDYSSCYKIAWSCEKANDHKIMDYADEFNKENFSKSKRRNSSPAPPKKCFIRFEKCELQGLEKDEETIRFCTFEGDYSYQVTPSGLFLTGETSDHRKKWLLRDNLPPFVDSSSEYIEKFDFCEKNEVAVICTGTGLLLLYKFDDESILSLVCFKTKTELFELISDNLGINSLSEESKDLNNEKNMLNNSISSSIDEVCVMGIFSIDNCILLILGTWMNGSKLSCLYYKKQETGTIPNFKFLLNIETEFREYETMATSLKVFELERMIETQSQRYKEEEFIGLIVGTNNGYLQLQYIPKDSIRKLIRKGQESVKFKDTCRFYHYNTWKVSNSFISDIHEMEISESLNRHFFICCDQPKVFFWSYSSGKGKYGLGVWSFFNIHSSWIPFVCQIRLPPSPLLKQKLIKKDIYATKTCILYVSHEEKAANEIHIDELANQNTEKLGGIQVSRKTSQQRSIKIGLLDTLQRYNCRSIPLEFTPEKVCFVEDLNIYVVAGVKERFKGRSRILKPILESDMLEKDEKGAKKENELAFIQSVICLISAQDMKIHYYKSLDTNVYPTCLEYVTLRASNDENDVRSFLALGTSKVEANIDSNSNSSVRSENYGKITLFSIINKNYSYTLLESTVYETEVAPFVIKEFKMSQLLISIENSLICLELYISKNLTESSSSSSSSSSDIWMDAEMDLGLTSIELRKKEAYCTHTMIVFIKIWNEEFILVGDLMRSVGLWEFDRYTGKFHEVCRDNSLAWVVEGLFLSKDMYLISDENRNLRVLMRTPNPENDETNTSLSCIAHLHVGESITTFQKGKFSQAYPETRKCTGGQDFMEESPGKLMFDEQIAFGTSQGGIYLLFSIKDDPKIFSQLALIEEAIISALKNSNMEIQLRNKVYNLKDSDLKKLFIRNSNSSLFTGVVGVLGGKNYLPLRWELNSTKESYNFEYDCSGTPRGFVCGDTIELFLDFSIDLQKSVLKELHSFKSAKRLKLPDNVNQLETLIEQLKNMH